MCARDNSCAGSTEYCCETDCSSTGGARPCYYGCSDLSAVNGELWKDSVARTCEDNFIYNYCTETGGYGSGWDPLVDGTFEEYAVANVSALQACCTCGGGLYAPPPCPLPPLSPPPLPPNPPNPPPLPIAPPVSIDGSVATLEDAMYAYPQLEDVLLDDDVAVIILQVDVALSGSLPTVYRALSIYGDCQDGGNASRCHISGEGAHRIFTLGEGAVVHLEALEMHSGYSGSSGGLVHADRARLTLLDCVLRDSVAVENGGAVFACASYVTCAACNVIGNKAETGAAMWGFNSSSLVVNARSLVEGNSADANHILGVGEFSTLTVNGSSRVINNVAKGYGSASGAEYNSTVTLDGESLIEGNEATGGGGMVVWSDSLGVVSGGSMIRWNHAKDNGGGIHMAGAICIVRLTGGSRLVGNVAAYLGGGILFGSTGHLMAEDAVISENEATQDGGAIFLRYPASVVTLTNTTLSGNMAGRNGGAIYALELDSIVILRRSEISHNVAGAIEWGNGGGIDSSGTVTLTDGTEATNNSATGDGGAVYLGGSAIVQVSNLSTVAYNFAERGAGLCGKDFSQLVVNGESAVSHNVAVMTGGGLWAGKYAQVTVEGGSTIAINSVASDQEKVGGGGIHLEAFAQLTVTNQSSITGNSAGFEYGVGGGVHTTENCQVQLVDAIVAENTAHLGGGIYAGSGTSVHVEHSMVMDNRASSDGGGVYGDTRARIEVLAQSLICRNIGDMLGGGIYGCDITVRDSTLTSNFASTGGLREAAGPWVADGSCLRAADARLPLLRDGGRPRAAGRRSSQGCVDGGAALLAARTASPQAAGRRSPQGCGCGPWAADGVPPRLMDGRSPQGCVDGVAAPAADGGCPCGAADGRRSRLRTAAAPGLAGRVALRAAMAAGPWAAGWRPSSGCGTASPQGWRGTASVPGLAWTAVASGLRDGGRPLGCGTAAAPGLRDGGRLRLRDGGRPLAADGAVSGAADGVASGLRMAAAPWAAGRRPSCACGRRSPQAAWMAAVPGLRDAAGPRAAGRRSSQGCGTAAVPGLRDGGCLRGVREGGRPRAAWMAAGPGLRDGGRLRLRDGGRLRGGLYACGAMDLVNANLSMNSVTDSGAGLAFIPDYVGDGRLSGCLLYRNAASQTGGGIIAGGDATGTLFVQEGSELLNNDAQEYGGGLMVSAGMHLIVEGSMVNSNEAASGGGIYISPDASAVIGDASNVSGNVASGSGGGAYVGDASHLEVRGWSRIAENSCQMTGGGIHGARSAYILIAEGATVKANKAYREGGGVAIMQGSPFAITVLKVDNATVEGNSARYYSGGGISSDSHCCVKLTTASIIGNEAGYTGGGVSSLNSHVEVSQSFLAFNTALYGGGFYINGEDSQADQAGVICVEATLISGNAATSRGGGGFLSKGSQLAMGPGGCGLNNASGRENTAEIGAALHLEQTQERHILKGVMVTLNVGSLYTETEDNEATCVLGMENSQLDLEAVFFDSNIGSGLCVESWSSVTLLNTTVLNHTSKVGGSLFVDETSVARVINSSFLRNRAQNGGGMFSAGNLSLVRAHFEGNECRGNGGALFLQLGGRNRFSECTFRNNSATSDDQSEKSNGGVMFFGSGTDANGFDMGSTQLANLSYSGNFALHGGAVGFWNPLNLTRNPQWPPCIGCETHESNVAAYGTADGWATAARNLQVDAVLSEEASGAKLENAIYVRIVDSSGTIVAVDSTSMVELHFSNSKECGVEEGSVRVQAHEGVATFSGENGLALKGNPGTLCQLYFTSDIDNLYPEDLVSNSSNLLLRYCVPGEQLKGESPWQYCEACPSGWLSLDNSSDCVECRIELECLATEDCEVECPGGNQYVICQGSYLAPQAQHCANDTKCLLDRLSSCDQSDACTTDSDTDTCSVEEAGNAGRVGVGVESVAELQLCDEERYAGRGTVMCGGEIPVICSESHYPDMAKGTCLKCPGRVAVLSAMIATLVGVGLLFAFVFTVFALSYSTEQYKKTKSSLSNSVMSGEAQATSVQLLKAKQAVSLVVGYVQVMGQLSIIYDGDVLPSDLTAFIVKLGIVNVDLGVFLNFQCVKYHYLPRLDRSSLSSGFMVGFWQAVFEPYLLCAVFGVVYLYMLRKRQLRIQQRRHTERAEGCPERNDAQKKQDKATELEWRNNIRAICMGAALFLMMFVHPTISTTMFQLFNCNEMYFNKYPEKQDWLKQDSEVECFTTTWYLAAVFSIFTLVTYVFGYPLTLFLGMRHLHGYQKVRMSREVAESEMKLVRAGVWIPCSVGDKATVNLYDSFFAGSEPPVIGDYKLSSILHKISSPLLGARHSKSTLLAPGTQSGAGAPPQTPASAPAEAPLVNSEDGPSVRNGDDACADTHADGTTVTTSDQHQSKSRNASDSALIVKIAGNHWRRKSVINAPVDMWLLSSSYMRVSALDEQSLDVAWKKLKGRKNSIRPPETARLRRRTQVLRNDLRTSDGVVSDLLLRDGSVIKDVFCFEKPDIGDGGLIKQVPVSRLDDPNLAKVLGQFRDPFEDDFYYWQCYEICRRMLQTGVVVLVSMLAGEDVALVYSLIISFTAILVHQRYSPYKNDALDELQLFILLNQFVVQTAILLMKLEPEKDEMLGIFLLLIQGVLLTYSMTLIIPAFRPVINALTSKSSMVFAPILSKISARYYQTLSSLSLTSPTAVSRTSTEMYNPTFDHTMGAEDDTETAQTQPDTDIVQTQPGTESTQTQPGTESTQTQPDTEIVQTQPSTETAQTQPSKETAQTQPSTETAKHSLTQILSKRSPTRRPPKHSPARRPRNTA
ncbi:hypothetical protein CYMTET_22564 [Cymbomonas tetramitiformis]|uniref:Right handed beta helix domain-containing protein n=1 Tax=Cymbomonas tetramitiformis TaxID=36881 RepID=A0AAE0FZQ8_9CHLO|nr:hypothetical protein CYMTET_22564 [Cymbomonas tetramitiformis]